MFYFLLKIKFVFYIIPINIRETRPSFKMNQILATRWSCQIQSISFFLIKSNRISRFLLERKERKVFSQISLIIDCEYCTFFFSCSFFDIFHTLCWEKITVNYVSKMLSIWICSCLLITISWDLCLAIYSKILSYLNWI